MPTRILIVFHSPKMANGLVELSAEYAEADYPLVYSAAGHPDGTIGTDWTVVKSTIEKIREDAGPLVNIVAVIDKGSAMRSYRTALAELGELDSENHYVSTGSIVASACWGAFLCHNGDPFADVCEGMDKTTPSFPAGM